MGVEKVFFWSSLNDVLESFKNCIGTVYILKKQTLVVISGHWFNLRWRKSIGKNPTKTYLLCGLAKAIQIVGVLLFLEKYSVNSIKNIFVSVLFYQSLENKKLFRSL